jgi:hypothetical protein
VSGIYDDGARYGDEHASKPSAREELLKRLGMAVGAYDSIRDNKLIDDLLHEEAEKIRRDRDSTIPLDPERSRGMTRSADLIDPYVK